MSAHAALQTTTPAGDRATEFKPVEGEVARDHYDGGQLMIVSYVFVWVLLFGFLAFMWTRQRALSARLASLEATIDRKAKERGGS